MIMDWLTPYAYLYEGTTYAVYISRETDDDGPAAEIFPTEPANAPPIATRYGRTAQRIADALAEEAAAYGSTHWSAEALAEGIDRIAEQATNTPPCIPGDDVRDLLATIDRSFPDLAARFIWYRDTEAGAAIRAMRERISR